MWQAAGVSLDEPLCPVTSPSFCFCVTGSAGGQWAPGWLAKAALAWLLGVPPICERVW